jgi:hypothetical protein
MQKPWSWFAASALIWLGGSAAEAATILERTVQIEIRPDGSVRERERLRVRLDNDRDFASWSPYLVYLDDNRELESLNAAVIRPDGKTENVARRALDTHEVAASGELHSSRKLRSVSFPSAPVGSVLSLDHEVKERPYFPAGFVELGSSSPTESLRVEVTGGGAGWRWRLDGSLPGLEVRETPGGVEVTGRSLPRLSPPDLAPASASSGAVLRYAWGDTGGWEKVGGWYDRLTAEVPRSAETVRARARELTAGLAGRREKLEALLAFVRRQVRYVAVEVGIGGYRPHTPQEVLEKRWGDCKDKAFLLIDLLREAGVEAWPVLILADEDGRVDRDFPSPFQFNHLIVALAADGLGLTEAEPVAGGYLFVDPTLPVGALSWLHPGTQDQEALVVRGGKGELVRTPIRQQSESRRLSVDVTLSPEGEATGEVRLELQGAAGWAYLDLLQTRRPEEIDRLVLETLGDRLPGVKLDQPKLAAHDSGVPTATLTARLRLVLPQPWEAGSVPSFPVPALTEMPAPGVLDGRELPVVAEPYSAGMTWSVTLPQDACPPAAGQDLSVENDLGTFRQSFKLEGRKLTLERRSELRRRWIEPAAFPALKEVALAEHRASKRRLRVECPTE